LAHWGLLSHGKKKFPEVAIYNYESKSKVKGEKSAKRGALSYVGLRLSKCY